MVEHNIVLNVKQGGPVDTGIEVTQGDYGKVKLLIRVKDNEEYIKNPVKASLFFKLSNGMVIQGAPRINVGTYEYIFQGSELQSPGKVAAVITLEYNEGRVSSCGFTFNCRAHPLFGKGFEAGPYIADLEKIVQQAQEQVDYLNELIEMMHEALNETVLTRADLVNNGETTQAGFKALDAAMGKTIMDQITQLNDNFASFIKSKIERIRNVSATEAGVGCFVTAINDFFTSVGVDPQKVIYVYVYNNNSRYGFIDACQLGNSDTLLIKSITSTAYTYIDVKVIYYG